MVHVCASQALRGTAATRRCARGTAMAAVNAGMVFATVMWATRVLAVPTGRAQINAVATAAAPTLLASASSLTSVLIAAKKHARAFPALMAFVTVGSVCALMATRASTARSPFAQIHAAVMVTADPLVACVTTVSLATTAVRGYVPPPVAMGLAMPPPGCAAVPPAGRVKRAALRLVQMTAATVEPALTALVCARSWYRMAMVASFFYVQITAPITAFVTPSRVLVYAVKVTWAASAI